MRGQNRCQELACLQCASTLPRLHWLWKCRRRKEVESKKLQDVGTSTPDGPIMTILTMKRTSPRVTRRKRLYQVHFPLFSSPFFSKIYNRTETWKSVSCSWKLKAIQLSKENKAVPRNCYMNRKKNCCQFVQFSWSHCMQDCMCAVNTSRFSPSQMLILKSARLLFTPTSEA